MATRLALDTSAALAFFDGDAAVGEVMNNADTVHVPSIAVGELYLGVLKCSKPEQEEAKIDALLSLCEVVPVDLATAHVYSRITHQLEKSGRRIPLNDIWIAALALQHDCALLARDAHFARIDGLRLLSL